MKKLSDWSAKRSGGRITITAKNAKGEAVKIGGIEIINSRPGKTPVATDKDGGKYELC